ncbi:MAG: glycosyltransferase [candidate division Zixibacteria bacterium]|nr:glycosyltransferase [candidate division Zixibacteria bacterium]
MFVTAIEILTLILSILYTTGVIILLVGLKSSFKKGGPSQRMSIHYPTVTVIVPARNESSNIRDIVKDLKTQDYPPEKTEFLIIDDFSEDDTYAIASLEIEDDDRFKLVKLSEQERFLAEGNLSAKKRVVDFGIKYSQSEIVLFTDADCRVKPQWISSMIAKYDDDVALVTGHVGFSVKSFFHGVLALESLATRIIAAGTIGLGNPVTCAGGNLSYRRQLYFDVGGLRDSRKSFSGDDTLLIQAAGAAGKKLMFNFDPQSFVQTEERGTLKEIIITRIRRLGITPQFKLDLMTISGSLFLYCWILALTPILIAIDASLALPLIFAWIWKFLFDFIILRTGAGMLRSGHLMKYLPVTALLYPYFIAFVGTVSFFIRGTWKGRKS